VFIKHHYYQYLRTGVDFGTQLDQHFHCIRVTQSGRDHQQRSVILKRSAAQQVISTMRGNDQINLQKTFQQLLTSILELQSRYSITSGASLVLAQVNKSTTIFYKIGEQHAVRCNTQHNSSLNTHQQHCSQGQ